ncbi:MAG: bifunctional aldolase/short-chain dehydrogenase [Sandaracinaceae bacterium]
MQSLYDDKDAPTDPLALRAYTSRLLGREPSLVLHGGGNTSVKIDAKDFFGDEAPALFVKGSGWDLASIEPAGFPAVRLSVLKRLATFESLTDTDMVREQRAAMLDPSSPDPSVEAILHAIIPHRFVDHTHADAVVAISNSADGEAKLRALYGDRVIYIPYVMPGFILARKVYELTRDVDWSRYEGMILLNHGVFTFGDDAKTSYERMIRLVSEAEDAIGKASDAIAKSEATRPVDLLELARLRRAASDAAGFAVIAHLDDDANARGYASRSDIASLATRGPVTPDHVIRTKLVPAIVGDEPEDEIAAYADAYRAYFARNASDDHVMLDPAPRFAVWKGTGVVALGKDAKAARQISDIARHTARVVQQGEAMGGWTPLGERDLFEMEYWELEQKKLKRGGAKGALEGRVALVSGGATGIGRACALELMKRGAAVCVLDIKPSVTETFAGANALGLICDVTDRAAVDAAVAACVRRFGGLDLLILNAGNFPPSEPLSTIDEDGFARTIELNLTGHLRVLRAATPFLELGVAPSVLVVASRNVPAPGPGAAAYSASKAGLTQLARVAALELGPKGVNVNILHPDKIFDTDLWTDEKIALRAKHYGVSVEAYKRSNLMGVEILSADVAKIACALLGPDFRVVTGAQVPVDGGNDRVI